MTTATNRRERGGALEALRFFAAAFIVLYHFGGDAPVPLGEAAAVFQRGWLATDFFLMLSGYVLGRAYGAALDEGRVGDAAFVGRRLARVWPAHLVVLLGFVVLVLATHAVGIEPLHPDHYRFSDLAAQAGLTHAWGLVHNADWNVPSWSLSALAVCYLAFPGAWRLTRRLNPLAALLAAPALILGSALLIRAALGRSLYDLPFDFGVLRALPLFLGGLLLSRGAAILHLKPRRAAALAAAGVFALCLLAAAPRGEAADFAVILALAAVIVGADAWGGPRSSLAAWGARISFALFITHALVGAVWFGGEHWLAGRYELGEGVRWGLWAASLPLAIAVAWAFERLVDQPLQSLIKRLRWRPGPRPAPAPSA